LLLDSLRCPLATIVAEQWTFTAPGNRLSQYQYDPAGRLVQADDPAGGRQTIVRTDVAAGHEVLRTTILGRATKHAVDNPPSGEQKRQVPMALRRLIPRGDVEEGLPLGGRFLAASLFLQVQGAVVEAVVFDGRSAEGSEACGWGG